MLFSFISNISQVIGWKKHLADDTRNYYSKLPLYYTFILLSTNQLQRKAKQIIKVDSTIIQSGIYLLLNNDPESFATANSQRKAKGNVFENKNKFEI